jgi:4-amino-4-deoxy-L-arabinose transferase-like glycosyltransferase
VLSHEVRLPEMRQNEGGHNALFSFCATLLLVLMALLMGGAARRESVTVDEVAHIGAGVSYLQKFDLRFNEEHPPLAKVIAAVPLVVRGSHADYSSEVWAASKSFMPGFMGQWVWGDLFLTRWNDPVAILAWARLPMLLLTLALGWVIYAYARRLGGSWAGLLCLSVYASTPLFLAFGPLVLTDLAITLFSLLTLWTFAEVWREPSRKKVMLLALSLAGALLSKFSAGILFFAFIAFALSTRWRPVPGQPRGKPDARAWRRLRRRATSKGILWAGVVVYVFYLVFSWNQTTDVLYLLGHGPAAVPLRRLLMPPWLYVRGVLMLLLMASRPTVILGHAYPHGVWFYFPVVFALKSPLGFLGLLALGVGLGVRGRSRGAERHPTIPAEVGLHWRVLWVSLIVFTGICMLGRLDISIRHFSIPVALLILMLAPLPRMLGQIRTSAPGVANLLKALTLVLCVSCLFTAVKAYPYYIPYVNALGLGRPVYTLVNDSNVDWNQALPEVRRFVELRGIEKIDLDWYGVTDPSASVPEAKPWNCQTPTDADAGQWAAVSANMILDSRNCVWLMQYPHEPLGGGSMYAVHLPDPIPPAGSGGGPPLPSAYHAFFGVPGGLDFRGLVQDLADHPEKFPQVMAGMQATFEAARKAHSHSPAAP